MKRISLFGLLLGASLIVPGVGSAQSVSFPGTIIPNPGFPLGDIPDDGGGGPRSTTGTPLNVTFDVSGLTGAITAVSLSLTMNHAWLGDLDVRLFKPGADLNVLSEGFVI